MRIKLFAVAGLAALLAACGETIRPASRTAPGPALIVMDSARLEEPDTAYLSFPTAVIVGDGGDLFVGDAASGRIHRFDRNGRLRRAIARKGRGPGEFTVPGAMSLIGGEDSLLAIADWQTEQVQVVSLPDGRFRRNIMTTGLPYTIESAHDTLYLGMLGRGVERTSAAIVVGDSGTLERFGHQPPEYMASAGVRTMHPYVSFVLTGQHQLTGFTGSNLMYDSMPGRELRAFEVPVSGRRPMPNAREMIVLFTTPVPDSLVAGMGSTLTGAYSLGGGNALLTHLDVVLSGPLLTADAWVSVLDLEHDRACVDTHLRTARAGKPLFTAIGDTLVMLEQRLTSDDRPETWVVRYRLDLSPCNWLSLLPPDSTR